MKLQFLMITVATAMVGTATASAREIGSGMATGKRMHKVATVKAGPLAGISAAQAKGIVSPRDAASGLPTGKRMHKVATVKAGPLAGISAAQAKLKAKGVVSPRDAASGLPTGKRMHKPFVMQKPFAKTTMPAVVRAKLAAPVAEKARAQVVKSKSNVKNN